MSTARIFVGTFSPTWMYHAASQGWHLPGSMARSNHWCSERPSTSCPQLPQGRACGESSVIAVIAVVGSVNQEKRNPAWLWPTPCRFLVDDPQIAQIACTSHVHGKERAKKQIQMALVNYHGFFKFQDVPGSSCIGFATSGMNDGLRANVHHLLGGYNSNQPELVRSNKYSTSPAQAGLLRNVKLPSSGIFSVTIASYRWSLTCCCGEKQPPTHPDKSPKAAPAPEKCDARVAGAKAISPWEVGQCTPLSSAWTRAAIDGNWRAEISFPKAGNVSFLPTNYERWHAEPWPLLEHIFVWCTKNWVRWTRLSQKQIDEIRWFRSTTPCVVGQCVLWPQQLCGCKSCVVAKAMVTVATISSWMWCPTEFLRNRTGAVRTTEQMSVIE